MQYDEMFLGVAIPLPTLKKVQLKASERDEKGKLLVRHHDNYSVAMNKNRRLAWFCSANHNAAEKKAVNRSALTSNWKTELGFLKENVTSDKWYRASKGLFDRGHLTPADAMEWGEDEKRATARANDTFYFSNAAPQVSRLNRKEWRMLEAFIGKECLKSGDGRLSVFTGCVLATDDPEYLGIREENFVLRIPRLFWKVIYYLDKEKRVCRVGFLMGQGDLLAESDLIAPMPDKKDLESKGDPFEELGQHKTYQVNVKMIEKLTGHKMPKAIEKHHNPQPHEIILETVDLPKRTVQDGELEGFDGISGEVLVGLRL